MYYAIFDKTSNYIKFNEHGQLCMFQDKGDAERYLQANTVVDVDGNGLRIVRVDVNYSDKNDRV